MGRLGCGVASRRARGLEGVPKIVCVGDRVLIWIADRGQAKNVVGVELTEHRIRRDYEKALPNLKLVAGDLFNPPVGDELFDVVFMNLVLHHLRFDLAGAVRAVHKRLKPGGSFVAIEPNTYSPLAVIAHILHNRSTNEGFLMPRTIRRVLLANGFERVDIGYFWRDRPWAKNAVLGSSFWLRARKHAA